MYKLFPDKAIIAGKSKYRVRMELHSQHWYCFCIYSETCTFIENLKKEGVEAEMDIYTSNIQYYFR